MVGAIKGMFEAPARNHVQLPQVNHNAQRRHSPHYLLDVSSCFIIRGPCLGCFLCPSPVHQAAKENVMCVTVQLTTTSTFKYRVFKMSNCIKHPSCIILHLCHTTNLFHHQYQA